MSRSSNLQSPGGFSLIELIIVVLILAALSAMVVPRIVASAQSAKLRTCETNVDLINTQIELYRATNGRAPVIIYQITYNRTYFPDGPPVCPLKGTYTLSRTNGRVTCSHR